MCFGGVKSCMSREDYSRLLDMTNKAYDPLLAEVKAIVERAQAQKAAELARKEKRENSKRLFHLTQYSRGETASCKRGERAPCETS